MREESFGPVFNPDGSPTEFTKQMLEGTGRTADELRKQPATPQEAYDAVIREVYPDGNVPTGEFPKDRSKLEAAIMRANTAYDNTHWSHQDFIASQGACPVCSALYGNTHTDTCFYSGTVSLDPGWGPD